MEPGRVIVGNAGILVTKVLYRKDGEAKRFIIVDAAMNDLIRPSLYGAYHEIRPLSEAVLHRPKHQVDVVGPVCESGDFLAKDRSLPEVKPGDHAGGHECGGLWICHGLQLQFTTTGTGSPDQRRRRSMSSGHRETYDDLVRAKRSRHF